MTKKQLGIKLTEAEQIAYNNTIERATLIANAGKESNIPIFIDAEESWIQQSIDEITLQLMQEFNQQSAMIYTTVQCYLTASVQTLKDWHQKAIENKFKLGIKLVRGAYMEKLRLIAAKKNEISPIHATKSETDQSYNEALKFCIDKINTISVCAATHNERSSYYLTQLMSAKGLANDDPRIFSAQLYGMSNHISFNLIAERYNVVKYLPYGPIKEVVPYLLRRANENQSIQGQTGRELALIKLELKRRKQKKEVE